MITNPIVISGISLPSISLPRHMQNAHKNPLYSLQSNPKAIIHTRISSLPSYRMEAPFQLEVAPSVLLHPPIGDAVNQSVFPAQPVWHCGTSDCSPKFNAVEMSRFTYVSSGNVAEPISSPVPSPVHVSVHEPLLNQRGILLSSRPVSADEYIEPNTSDDAQHEGACHCSEEARLSGIGMCAYCKWVEEVLTEVFEAVKNSREKWLMEEKLRGNQGEHLICGYCGNVRPSYVAKFRAMGDPK